MFTRKMVRIPSVAALFAAVLFAPGKSADAQSASDEVVACISEAADKLVECTKALPWYLEDWCYARYASDGILCLPSILLKS